MTGRWPREKAFIVENVEEIIASFDLLDDRLDWLGRFLEYVYRQNMDHELTPVALEYARESLKAAEDAYLKARDLLPHFMQESLFESAESQD